MIGRLYIPLGTFCHHHTHFSTMSRVYMCILTTVQVSTWLEPCVHSLGKQYHLLCYVTKCATYLDMYKPFVARQGVQHTIVPKNGALTFGTRANVLRERYMYIHFLELSSDLLVSTKFFQPKTALVSVPPAHSMLPAVL